MSRIEWTEVYDSEYPTEFWGWDGWADGQNYHVNKKEEMDDCQLRHDAWFNAIALANGYVKVGRGQVVIDRASILDLIHDHCGDCMDSPIWVSCNECDFKAIKEARDE